MKNTDNKIYEKLIPFVFSIIISSLFIFTMWDYSIQYSNDSTPQISVYLDGSNWLTDNLLENETSILPIQEVFLAVNPILKQQSKSYQSFWDDANVDVIHATNEEKNLVKENFWNYVMLDTNNVKYIVIALNDKYMISIFDIHPRNLPSLDICNNINSQLFVAERFNFEIPSTQWKNSLIICELKYH